MGRFILLNGFFEKAGLWDKICGGVSHEIATSTQIYNRLPDDIPSRSRRQANFATTCPVPN